MFDLTGKVALVTGGSRDKEARSVGDTYPGIVPIDFEQWKHRIPGLHFPLPDAPAEG